LGGVTTGGVSGAGAVAAGPGALLLRALNGVVVSIGGKPLPLLFVSPEQINVQIPANLIQTPAATGPVAVPVLVLLGNSFTQPGVTIAVAP